MPMAERFYDLYVTSSAEDITPSDVTEFAAPRSLYIGTGGDVAVTMLDDDTSVILKNVPNSTFLPIAVKQVLSTGTTASDILGLSVKK